MTSASTQQDEASSCLFSSVEACITGALRAKRGERGILSQARNDSSGPMPFLSFWTPSTGFGIPCLRILIISGIPDFTSRNIPDFALRKEKFLVFRNPDYLKKGETPNEIVPNSGVLRLQSEELKSYRLYFREGKVHKHIHQHCDIVQQKK